MASKGVNKVILIGNLGSDPEIRYMPNGEAVATLSIATTETWKDKNTGQPQERTEWHRLVFYRKLAEIVGEWLKKGAKIYVEGRLQTRQWEKDGVKHYTTEIIVAEMQMLGGDRQQGEGRPAAAPRQSQPPRSNGNGATPPENSNVGGSANGGQNDLGFDPLDDIPF